VVDQPQGENRRGSILIEWLVFFLLCIIIFLLMKPSKREAKHLVPLLKAIQRSGKTVLVRPTGEFVGIVEEKKDYWDEKYETKRRKIVYRDMNNELREEPADRVRKDGEVEDVVKIERSGGIALTELMGSEHRPIYVGPLAKRLKTQEEDMGVLKDDMRRQDKIMEKVRERNRKLVLEARLLKEENVKLREDMETYAKQSQDNKRKLERARAEVDRLTEELKQRKREVEDLKKVSAGREKYIDEMLAKWKERERELAKIKAME